MEEYISVTFGFVQPFNKLRFLSSSLDSLVKTLVEQNHIAFQNFRRKIVGEDSILNFVNEIEKLISKDRYKNESIESIQKGLTWGNWKNRESFKNAFIWKNTKILKTDVPGKGKYPNENFAYL